MKLTARQRQLWAKAAKGPLAPADREELRAELKPYPKLGRLLPFKSQVFEGGERHQIKKLLETEGEVSAQEVHAVVRLLERIYQHEAAPAPATEDDDTPPALLLDRRIRDLEAAEHETRAAGSPYAADRVKHEIDALRRSLADMLPPK